MYRAIVARQVRAVWRRMSAGDLEAPARMAAKDMAFTFVGDNPLGATFSGPEAFRAWLQGVFRLFPGIRFEVGDVVVAGPPWNTRVSVRLGISATLADGTAYTNEAAQWMRLRWGRILEDWVLEDTKALEAACERQRTAA